MATEVLLPRQGNTVESCVILEWRKSEGDSISEGEIICEVETDKAAFEVESPTSGTVLKRFFKEGDDVPVLSIIAAIGEQGEDVSALSSSTDGGGADEAVGDSSATPASQKTAEPVPERKAGSVAVSPRAKLLASSKGIDHTTIAGSGPGGRIIERDVEYVLKSREPFTPAAIEEQLRNGMKGPANVDTAKHAAGLDYPGPVEEKPVKGVRKLIAQRMTAALQSTAQLTLNSSADARGILGYRKKLKEIQGPAGLSEITINDFILYAAVKNLLSIKEMNAHFLGDKITQFSHVHLGFAVETSRGLMVPVIRNAHAMTLKQLSEEAKRLIWDCVDGGINPDELRGATFTVTNLGALGIETFTPIVNAPEVGILGVNNIQLKPVLNENGDVDFISHIGFSLTIDHQAVDGALGAKFLKSLAKIVENFEIYLAG